MITGIRGCAVASGAVAVVEVLTTVGKVGHRLLHMSCKGCYCSQEKITSGS